jgi:hypothetical protein
MGPAGLTAVFGMGTGVAPPVWSPEKCPAGGEARRGTGFPSQSHTKAQTASRMSGASATFCECQRALRDRTAELVAGPGLGPFFGVPRGSAPIGVVKLLGC